MTALCEFENISNHRLFLKLPWNFSYLSLKLSFDLFPSLQHQHFGKNSL